MDMLSYWRLFVDAWRLFRSLMGSPQPDWGAVARGADDLAARYHGNRLAQDIALAIVSELENVRGKRKS